MSRCLSESNAEPDRADLHPLSHARRFAFSHHPKAWAGPLRGPAHALLLTFLPLLRSIRRFRQAGPPPVALRITVRGDIAAAGSPRPPVAPPNRLALSLLPAHLGPVPRSCRRRPPSPVLSPAALAPLHRPLPAPAARLQAHRLPSLRSEPTAPRTNILTLSLSGPASRNAPLPKPIPLQLLREPLRGRAFRSNLRFAPISAPIPLASACFARCALRLPKTPLPRRGPSTDPSPTSSQSRRRDRLRSPCRHHSVLRHRPRAQSPRPLPTAEAAGPDGPTARAPARSHGHR